MAMSTQSRGTLKSHDCQADNGEISELIGSSINRNPRVWSTGSIGKLITIQLISLLNTINALMFPLKLCQENLLI